jgi:hypothetical protein
MGDPTTPAVRGPIGAYGLRLENVERARALLVPAEADWPTLRIRRSVGQSELPYDRMDATVAELKLQNGGAITVDRARGEARFLLPEPVRTAAIVHPLLAPVAAVMAYWSDRESFHAGAFVAGGKAWGVVGDRGAGKSTVMGALARAGVQILADDLLVLDGLRAFAGPRSVDLRREAARQLGGGEALGVVGARERWRLRLEPVGSDHELGGWIFLAWGREFETRTAGGGDRLVRLTGNRGTHLPLKDTDALLELAALPGWILSRPRDWRFLDRTVDWLGSRPG